MDLLKTVLSENMNDRKHQRQAFLAEHSWADTEITPLVPDASARRYFRLEKGVQRRMLMDDIGGKQNVIPFVKITAHLTSLGIRTPAIYHQDLDGGFLILEDLGGDTFSTLLLKDHSEKELCSKAMGVLGKVHRQIDATKIDLGNYDFEHFINEAYLFTDWYLPATQKRKTGATQRSDYESVWWQIFESLPTLQSTLVLRDYHIDNLMMVDGECAVLDYQDALIGPIAYDVVSLLEDARRDVSGALNESLKRQYLNQNPGINEEHFNHHLVVWGAQRHCKVAGIFVRLWLRDDKPVYLQHLNRVMRLIGKHIENPIMLPLKRWLTTNMNGLEHPRLDPELSDKLREFL